MDLNNDHVEEKRKDEENSLNDDKNQQDPSNNSQQTCSTSEIADGGTHSAISTSCENGIDEISKTNSSDQTSIAPQSNNVPLNNEEQLMTVLNTLNETIIKDTNTQTHKNSELNNNSSPETKIKDNEQLKPEDSTSNQNLLDNINEHHSTSTNTNSQATHLTDQPMANSNNEFGVPKDDDSDKSRPILDDNFITDEILNDIKHSTNDRHQKCQFKTDKTWLDPQFNANKSIKKPSDLEIDLDEPHDQIDANTLNRIQGSIIGMALGDALGAHVEFRPRAYLLQHPVKDLEGGGTWGLLKGQFTDDTSMALCLANSLLARRDFCLYDQLVRYKWWFRHGYMSSTGKCFDIGAATSQSLIEFEYRQRKFSKEFNIPYEDLDYLSDPELLKKFTVYCSEEEVAGNGALMRLAPVPLFFFQRPQIAVEYSGRSGQITHGDTKAYDACRYYGALIAATLQGYTKEQLLDNDFYPKHKHWFGTNELHEAVRSIAHGSYKRDNGYDDGIRGKGYIVQALEAALWAFWSDGNSFERGALAAVNLGDDTDTTAAIYGQLAGAYYGYDKLPSAWVSHVYARTFMEKLSKWILYEGNCWHQQS